MELFSQEEYQAAKFRDLLKCECDWCKTVVFKTKRYFFNHAKFGNVGNACSKKCAGKLSAQTLGNDLSQEIVCSECGEKTLAQPSRIRNASNNFCSRSCNVSYQNKHKTFGIARSKLEVWLEERLKIIYPNLEIHFNRKDAINSELDFYFPSLGLAFELNGIFHYEPIFGEEKLCQIQNNDSRKFQACLENGIELCIIDSSKQKRVTDKNSQIFLDIITKLVNEKLSKADRVEVL